MVLTRRDLFWQWEFLSIRRFVSGAELDGLAQEAFWTSAVQCGGLDIKENAR